MCLTYINFRILLGITVTCEHHTILCVGSSTILVPTHTKHNANMHVHDWLQGMLKYNCIICSTMNPLLVDMCTLEDWCMNTAMDCAILWNKILAKASLSYLNVTRIYI